MRKCFLTTLIVAVLSSCGVQIKSIADGSVAAYPYSNPLIVIPFESGVTKNFTSLLKTKIEDRFKADNRKVEILLVEQKQDEFKLNSTTDINTKINVVTSSNNKDLVLIFMLTKMQFFNGVLRSVTYQITGRDLRSKKEVWKAEFTSNSSFGQAVFIDKAATRIYEKLKLDKVL
ncbi:MAG: hypothetical protein QM734_16670 [Cyclobacteriaceae bacterium]